MGGSFQLLQSALVMGFPIAEGAEMLMVTSIGSALATSWGLTTVQVGSIASLSFIGLAVGTYISGVAADMFGRRPTIIAAYAGMVVFGLGTCLSTGFYSMAAMRFLNGVACGFGVPPSFSLLAESASAKARPLIFCINSLSYVVGECWTCLGLLLFMPDLNNPAAWRLVTLWSSVPAAVCIVPTCLFLYESPHWLAVQGKTTEAEAVLHTMARMNGTAHMFSDEQEASLSVPPSSPRPERPRLGFRDLVASHKHAAALAVFGVLCAVGNIGTFGLTYYWPNALREAVMRSHGAGRHMSAAKLLLIVRSTGLPVNFVNMVLMASPLGHRSIIATSAAFGAACSFALSTMAGQGPLLLFGTASTIAGTVLYTTVLAFLPESFPTELRGTALGSAIFLGRLGSVVSPMLYEELGPSVFLRFLAGGFAVASVAVAFLDETKGKPLEDYTDEPEDDTTSTATARRSVASAASAEADAAAGPGVLMVDE